MPSKQLEVKSVTYTTTLHQYCYANVCFVLLLVQIGKVVSEKIQFDFLYVHDLGPMSSNDLDLQYSHNFIYSIRCLLLPTFRSLAAIVSEKSTVFTFSYRKAYVTKFDLAVK